VITIIKIASTASSVFNKSSYAREAKAMIKGALLHPSFVGTKQRPPMKRGNPETQGGSKQRSRWKKRQPQNGRGSKQSPPMKKEATPKYKGLKIKHSDEKRGNPKM
jgi:hypothetical protein